MTVWVFRIAGLRHCPHTAANGEIALLIVGLGAWTSYTDFEGVLRVVGQPHGSFAKPSAEIGGDQTLPLEITLG